MRLPASHGGRSTIGATGYVEGPPELVVEVAASSAAYDLHSKRRVYARSGVQEYIAIQMYERRLDWLVLREGVYEPTDSDEHGVIRSQVFGAMAPTLRAMGQRFEWDARRTAKGDGVRGA